MTTLGRSHVVLGAVVLGLFGAGLGAGSAVVAAVAIGAGVCVAIIDRPRVGIVVAVALVAGAGGGTARLHALERDRLGPLPRAAELTVVVLDAPRARSFGASVASARIIGGAADGSRVLLRVNRPQWGGPRWPAAPIGALIRVRGRLQELPPFEGAAARRHTHVQVLAARLVAVGRRARVLGAIDGVRSRAQDAFGQSLRPELAALLGGMVLGQDAALSPQTRDALRASGLAHLVAASGANVALLVALVFALGTLAGVSRPTRLVWALGAVAVYVPLAGGGASIQRAGIMGAAAIVAAMASRPAQRWYALLLAAAVTLALSPWAVFDVGWQLSFAAVAAIALIAGPIQAVVARRLPGPVAEATALTVAATLGTAPLLALHFGELSVVGPVVNVLAAPVVAPITWLGSLAAVAGQADETLARPLLWLAAPLLGYLLALARFGAGLPGAVHRVSGGGGVALVGVVALGALAVLALRPARRRAARRRAAAWARGLGGAVAIGVGVALVFGPVVAGVRPARAPSLPTVSFLDIGQGDATLLQAGGSAVLLDTGPPGGPILRRLREAGVRRLDALVITHMSADHDGSAADVLASVPVAMVLDGGAGWRSPGLDAARRVARQRRIPVVATDRGQRWKVGAIALEVLWPVRSRVVPGTDANLTATVIMARLGATRVFLPADAEAPVTVPLRPVEADLLKVAHHGSQDTQLDGLLALLRPRVAVMEVGQNTYGHPYPATLAALARRVPVVRRTDRDGTVRVTIMPGGRLQVSTAR